MILSYYFSCYLFLVNAIIPYFVLFETWYVCDIYLLCSFCACDTDCPTFQMIKDAHSLVQFECDLWLHNWCFVLFSWNFLFICAGYSEKVYWLLTFKEILSTYRNSFFIIWCMWNKHVLWVFDALLNIQTFFFSVYLQQKPSALVWTCLQRL